VSYEKLKALFERYQKLEPNALDLDQSPGYYSFELITGVDERDGQPTGHIVELSGHYDRRNGRLTSRGSREKAYERLKQLIAKEEGVSHATD
jgi:hypothetical protein